MTAALAQLRKAITVFKKNKGTEIKRNYCWPDREKKFQSLRVVVDKFLFTVSGSFGAREISFEGFIPLESLRGMRASIEFESLDPFETPTYLKEIWNAYSESTQGVCRYREQINYFEESTLDITCYCEEGKYTLLSLEKLLAFVNNDQSSVVFDLEIDFPAEMEQDFWGESWRKKDLRVRNWRFICGTKES